MIRIETLARHPHLAPFVAMVVKQRRGQGIGSMLVRALALEAKLIMRSHGHGSVVNVVMGSVATKVLASCKVTVLLVN